MYQHGNTQLVSLLYHIIGSIYHDHNYGHRDVFIKVVESVLTADKFQLPSPVATTTKEIAVAVIQWSKEEAHTEQLTVFVNILRRSLEVAVMSRVLQVS